MVVHNPSIVAAADAKARLSEMLDRVERGEEITITRHGEPVARLVPALHPGTPATGPVAQRIIKARAGHTLGGLSWKELRDEGRR